jgi:acyl-CoA dehydrogenase family protein 9
MNRNVRGITRNEDEAIEKIAGAVIAQGGYLWDVI